MRYKIEPWQHQREAIAKSLAPGADNFALLWEPGTGKTSTTINILRHKFNQQKRVLRTLIFCPPVVVKNWRDEWAAHSTIDISKVVPLTGPVTARVKTFLQHAYSRGIDGKTVSLGTIFVTNYEALLMPILFTMLRNWNPEAVIFDESHKLKNHSAQRSKRADALANPRLLPGERTGNMPSKPFTMILTGTPVLQNGMDLFMQYKILDGGRLLGDNFYKFRAKYCIDKNAGMPKEKYFPKWEMAPFALDDIAFRARAVTSVAKKKDCLDLPPYLVQTYKVPMGAEQAKTYEALESDLIAYLDAMPVTAPMALTKALRLLQVTSGFVNLDNGEARGFGLTPKDTMLKELLEDITQSHKVIIWAVFRENYQKIRTVCKSLDLDYVELHGEVSESARNDAIDRFKSDPECKVLIGHPGSGGIGVNLVSASYSIFYSRTFSLEHSLQAEARNYRGGSNIHESVTRIDLVCEHTIDEQVQKRLVSKMEIGETVLRQIAAERRGK